MKKRGRTAEFTHRRLPPCLQDERRQEGTVGVPGSSRVRARRASKRPIYRRCEISNSVRFGQRRPRFGHRLPRAGFLAVSARSRHPPRASVSIPIVYSASSRRRPRDPPSRGPPKFAAQRRPKAFYRSLACPRMLPRAGRTDLLHSRYCARRIIVERTGNVAYRSLCGLGVKFCGAGRD